MSPNNFDALLSVIACPDCQGELRKTPRFLVCQSCRKQCFYKDRYIDLLPSKPLQLKNVYTENVTKYYDQQFHITGDTVFPGAKSWNDYHNEKDLNYRKFLDDEYKIFEQFFPQHKQVAVDISGGTGYYTQKLSRFFDTVIHCDISLEFLQSAQNHLPKKLRSKIWFVRADYLQPPFKKKSVDLFVSTDSFIYYGIVYDMQVLKQLQKKLNLGGRCIFDVHYRKFYAPYPVIFEYNQQHLKKLKRSFPSLIIKPFWRVPVALARIPGLTTFTQPLFFLPPIRYIGVLQN